MGVWTTTDPIGMIGGVNLYQYVRNNPVNLLDVLGLFADSEGMDDTRSEGSLQDANNNEDGIFGQLWSDIKSTLKPIGQKLSEFHFEDRKSLNKNLPATIADAEKAGSEWKRMPDSMNVYHDNGDAYPESKFVNSDGREAIYDGATGELVTDPCLEGTYNYMNPPDLNEIRDTIGLIEAATQGLGHFIADMAPYYAGGNVRGDDNCNEK